MIVGSALTCETGPADVLAALAALEVAQPGDRLSIATGGWVGTASIGDLFAASPHNAGLAAIVTDGLVRDVDGLARAGVPVFAAGLSPASPAGRGPETLGLPVVIGGLRADSGDAVVCERTGVVVVRCSEIERTLSSLEPLVGLESQEAERVAAGQVVPASMRALLEPDRVCLLDRPEVTVVELAYWPV